MSDITHLITMQCSAGERTLNFALDCVLTLRMCCHHGIKRTHSRDFHGDSFLSRLNKETCRLTD